MNVKRVLSNTSRTLVGLVFAFSGFVKIIDPLGTQYKIEDYLHAMGSAEALGAVGPFISHLDILAFPAAMVLVTMEFIIGLAMLLNIFCSGKKFKEHWMIYLPVLMMLFMTPLTLWIALYNPVEDCGCFGDALKISNWATFWKNIGIDALLVMLLCTKSGTQSTLRPGAAIGTLCVLLATSLGISIYCLIHLPLIDFRPYKIGTDIEQGMEIPQDAPRDSSIVTLTYKNAASGEVKDFTINDYPKEGSGWDFVESKTTVVRKGYEPPIHDFVISNEDYEDITYDILNDKGETVLIVMYKIENACQKQVDRLNSLYQQAKSNGQQFYAVTGSDSGQIEEFKAKNKPNYPICSCDGVTLKTIVRSNPGYVLIKNGVIQDKKALRDLKE